MPAVRRLWRAVTVMLALTPMALLPTQPGQASEALKLPPRPLAFEVNRGQTDPSVAFLARGRGYVLYLRPAEAVFSLKTSNARPSRVLRMHLVGAVSRPAMTGAERLPGRRNYYIGNDPSHWRTGIATYREVREPGVYPGVDLLYHGRKGRLEYDFIVAPGADPRAVRLRFDGADALRIDGRGDLVLEVGDRRVIHHAPVAYQLVDGHRVPVAARYVRRGPLVAFALGRYDARRPLIIDPALNYSSYLGGSRNDQARAVTLDASGNIYITGATQSTDFPGASNAQSGGTDAFVTKLKSDGSVDFSTYLGSGGTLNTSPGAEMGNGIALDSQNRIYVTGGTAGQNVSANAFPTLNGYKASCPTSDGDVFVSILNNAGTLAYSTCIGGGLYEAGMGIAVDATGDAYVAGWTTSGTANPFPTTGNAIQATKVTVNSVRDGFFFKLDPTKTGTAQLLYSTYLGGAGSTNFSTDSTYAYAVAVDDKGMAYVTGETQCNGDFLPASFAFPKNAYAANQGGNDAFVLKIDPSGGTPASSLTYATFFGGTGEDIAYGIALVPNTSDNVFIAGSTSSATGFPPANGYDGVLDGPSDGFVAELNLTGSSLLVYSTYLGGSGNDVVNAITVDSTRRAFVTGTTSSPDFPSQPAVSGFPGTYGGGNDAFVTAINGTGASLGYSGLLGGSGADSGQGIALDAANTVYVVGGTGSPDFPTHNPQQAQLAATAPAQDAFLAEVGVAADLGVVINGVGTPQESQPFTYEVTMTNYGPDPATGVSLKLQFRLKSNGAPSSGLGSSPDDQFSNCVYDGPTATLTCPIGTIQPGSKSPTTVDVTGTFTSAQTLTAIATISASEPDPKPSNNSDSIDETGGVPSPTGSGPSTPGGGTTGGGTLGPAAIFFLLIALASRKRRRLPFQP